MFRNQRTRGENGTLGKKIRRAKNEAWAELCTALDEDVWGQGYKLAVRHLKGLRQCYDISDERKLEIAMDLFPQRRDSWETNEVVQDIPLFTVAELESATENIKVGSAPGLDRILPQSVKDYVPECPSQICDLLNRMLATQSFPVEWKIARVALIPKSEDEVTGETKYRPICLLKVLAKLYETLIRDRIAKEIEETQGLSNQQYGFRKGRSTIMAIKRVVGRPRE